MSMNTVPERLAALREVSSLASLFNSSAMLFTIDFYKRFRPQTSEKKATCLKPPIING